MPIPALLGLALPALFKAGVGLSQLGKKVERVDTVTPAEKERLASFRQQQAAALPGLGYYQNRLAGVQAAGFNNAARGAASSSDLLAAATAGSAQRQQGELQLGLQGQQYHDRATQQLNTGLQQLAQHQQEDTNRANQAQAAVKSGGLTNIFGGLTDAASVGAYGLANAAQNSSDDSLPAGSYLRTTNPSVNVPASAPYRYPQQLTNPFPYGYPTR